MANEKRIKCAHCGSDHFFVDWDRSGYMRSNPDQPLRVDEKSELRWETYFKCAKCGWQLSMPAYKHPDEDTVTFTFDIKA